MAKLAEFASSLETTREWINELMDTLQTDESTACRAFRVTVHELRDQLTVAETADLAAQLPLLLRGIFYEGWRPSGKPMKRRSKADFVDKVAESFKEISDIAQVEEMVRDVFRFLDRRVSPGEIRHVVNSLSKDLRSLWPDHAGERCLA